jgi:hypothetical protein
MVQAPIGYSGRMRAWLLLAISAAAVQPGGPSLKDVLAHAAEYVASYHESMAAVVAEERYVQTLTTKDETSPTQRTLLSDFAIVGGEGYQPWMAFRDVLEVDGRTVRDRDGRMERLFSRGADIDLAFAINRESARYNLGTIVRTINTPTVALDFLLRDEQPRFRFRSRDRPAPPDGTWEIAFEERDRPTIIRTPLGRDVVSRGSFAIDPADGHVLRSTLMLMDMRATIVVDYGMEPRLGIWVPVKMTESYRMPDETLEAVASYSNYRRFETSVRVVPK